MKKILLLEDKIQRDSLKQANIDFNKFTNIEVMLGENACNVLLNSFKYLDNFDVIIVHAGIQCDEKQNILIEIKKYCSKKNTTLVTFSGGADVSFFKDDTLEVTAKSLYTNLPVFLSSYPDSSHILMLAYGEKWSINILLNIVEKLNIFIEENRDDLIEDYDEFEDDFDLIKLKNIISNERYTSQISKNKNSDQTIKMHQIKIIKENLISLISEQINA